MPPIKLYVRFYRLGYRRRAFSISLFLRASRCARAKKRASSTTGPNVALALRWMGGGRSAIHQWKPPPTDLGARVRPQPCHSHIRHRPRSPPTDTSTVIAAFNPRHRSIQPSSVRFTPKKQYDHDQPALDIHICRCPLLCVGKCMARRTTLGVFVCHRADKRATCHRGPGTLPP